MFNPAAIDLTASYEKPSTCAWLDGHQIKIKTLSTNQEIATWLIETRITHVGLDAPLCIPQGLNGKFGSRLAERELLKKGIPVLATSLLAPLTFRGIHLGGLLKNSSIRIYEIYPFSVRHFYNIGPDTKKNQNLHEIREGLINKWPFEFTLPEVKNHDEADAIFGLWMVLLIHQGKALSVGEESEGIIWIPAHG